MEWGSWHCTGDRDQDHPHGKEMQKSKMAVWGGLTSRNTTVGSHSFLRQIFPTQESNQGLLCFRWILYQPSHQESLRTIASCKKRFPHFCLFTSRNLHLVWREEPERHMWLGDCGPAPPILSPSPFYSLVLQHILKLAGKFIFINGIIM